MSETRTTMAKDTKSPAGGKGGAKDGADQDETPKKSKKKLLALTAAVLVAGGGGGWWFLLGPGAGAEGEEAAVKEEEVELGPVVTVDPVSINLADNHYLKLGLGLQPIAEVSHEPDGALALDAAISLYSGRPMDELKDPAQRDALKAELKEKVKKAYHEEVVDVYFTEYVMQ